MMPSAPAQDLVEPLHEALDEEIAALNLRRSQLALLREAILARDDEAVGRLLGQLEQAQVLQSRLELRLQSIREALAEQLDLSVDAATLSGLIGRLGPQAARRLDLCRRQVVHLVKALQRQHLELAILLHECARINRLMLEQFLRGAQPVATYGAGGHSVRHDHRGMMDMES